MARRRRSPGARLVRPTIGAVLIVYIVSNAFCQPGYSAGWSRTVVGEFCSNVRGEARGTTCYLPSTHFATPSASGGWQVSTDQWSSSDFPKPGELVVSSGCRTWRSGFWSPTTEATNYQVTVMDAATWTPALTTAQRSSLLAAIDAAYPGAFPAATRAADAAGGTSTRTTLWLGVLNDVSIIAAFLGLAILAVPMLRKIRMTPVGVCASCGYDLHGLRSPVCPECGNVVEVGAKERLKSG